MSLLSTLKKTKSSRTLGIDCSTKTLAFATYKGRTPISCGEIAFQGSTLFERLNDAHRKVPQLVEAGILKADYVAFEGAIMAGTNAKTGLSLAYVYGAVMGGLMQSGMTVVTVAPLTWQSYIGNPNLKKHEKEQLKAENPGRSDSWYRNAGREFRKQRTMRFAEGHFPITGNDRLPRSDNVSDAIGIAWYAVNELVH